MTSPEEQSIRDVVEQFVVAGKNVDRDAVTALMCPDDAQYYLDSTEDPGEDDGLQDPVTSVDLRWTAVCIAGEVAAATLRTPWSSGPITSYLRKLLGAWVACEDAEGDMAAAPPTPGSRTATARPQAQLSRKPGQAPSDRPVPQLRRKLTGAERDEIAASSTAGTPITNLAQEYGVHRIAVDQLLRRLGIRRRPNPEK